MTNTKYGSLKSLLLAATMFVSPLVAGSATPAAAGIGISVELAPPMLPVYVQPPMPEEGYIWTPGYWAWGQDQSYYWVPGTWVMPPTSGVLWTPPYWGWGDGGYLFHGGYWGLHVGFYGGINYGFGDGGNGYEGGRWEGGGFVYNRSANNFGSVQVRNSYERNVSVVNDSHVAYTGGAGGLRSEPTAQERSYEQERHVSPTAEQVQHSNAAARNPEFAASRNHGNPPVAATSRPTGFAHPGDRPEARAARPAVSAEARHATAAAAPRRQARPTEHAAPHPAAARETAPRQVAPRQAAPRAAPHPAAPRESRPEERK